MKVSHLQCTALQILSTFSFLNSQFWYKDQYTGFCVNMFSFLMGNYLGVRLLGHMVSVYFTTRKCQIVFQSGCAIVQFHPEKWFQCFTISFNNI